MKRVGIGTLNTIIALYKTGMGWREAAAKAGSELPTLDGQRARNLWIKNEKPTV